MPMHAVPSYFDLFVLLLSLFAESSPFIIDYDLENSGSFCLRDDRKSQCQVTLESPEVYLFLSNWQHLMEIPHLEPKVGIISTWF